VVDQPRSTQRYVVQVRSDEPVLASAAGACASSAAVRISTTDDSATA